MHSDLMMMTMERKQHSSTLVKYICIGDNHISLWDIGPMVIRYTDSTFI